MESINGLIVIAAGAIALGGLIGGIFSYRRNAEFKLKDSIIADWEKRAAQLEAINAALEADLAEAQQRVQELESERQLPLTQLTELIVKQHADQMSSLEKMTINVAKAANAMNRAVKSITKGGAK